MKFMFFHCCKTGIYGSVAANVGETGVYLWSPSEVLTHGIDVYLKVVLLYVNVFDHLRKLLLKGHGCSLLVWAAIESS